MKTMKKLLIVAIAALALVGCEKNSDFIGNYKGENYLLYKNFVCDIDNSEFMFDWTVDDKNYMWKEKWSVVFSNNGISNIWYYSLDTDSTFSIYEDKNRKNLIHNGIYHLYPTEHKFQSYIIIDGEAERQYHY